MKLKKIDLIIFHPYSMIGGADKSLSRLINNLNHKKYNITFITLNKPQIKKYLKKKINIIILNKRKTIFSILKIRQILKKFLKENDKIIFFSNQNFANILSFAIKYKLRNIKHIIVERNHIDELNYYSGIADFFKKKIIKILIKLLYNKSDIVIGNCKKLSNDLSRYSGVKVRTIYNPAFDNEIYKLSKKNIVFKKNKIKNIINVGRLELQKDQMTLIKAVEKIDNVSLTIIGYGSLYNVMSKYIKENGLSRKIKILNNITNPYPYIKKADLFVLTSLFEGFPNVLAEAIMLRIPIISSNCNSGPAEILLQKKGPQIYKKGNYIELEKKIKDFLLEPKIILSKRDFLFDKLKRFNKGKIVKEYDDLFTKLFI